MSLLLRPSRQCARIITSWVEVIGCTGGGLTAAPQKMTGLYLRGISSHLDCLGRGLSGFKPSSRALFLIE
jgi:hypothetical protein